MESKYIECDCQSTEHTIKFTMDIDKEIPTCSSIYLEVQLYQWRPWYKRIWVAIKYLCGYECKYGHWDCTSLGLDKVNELHALIHDFYKQMAPSKPEDKT